MRLAHGNVRRVARFTRQFSSDELLDVVLPQPEGPTNIYKSDRSNSADAVEPPKRAPSCQASEIRDAALTTPLRGVVGNSASKATARVRLQRPARVLDLELPDQ